MTKAYDLTYNTNGGENGPAVASLLGNEHYAIAHIDTVTPIRPGFTFAGWSFTPDGPAEVFSSDLLTLTSEHTVLYAVWTEEAAEVPTTSGEEENAEPLGVVATSKDVPHSDPGIALGFSLLGLAVLLAAVFATRTRGPKILSKNYENSDSDFDF